MLEDFGSFLLGAAMFGNMLISAYAAMVAHKNAGVLEKSASTIKTLEINTNSKLEQLLKITGESEHAKGVIQGKAES